MIKVTADIAFAVQNVMELGLKQALDSIEYALIREVRKAQGGHLIRTAAVLGLTREGLWKKRKRLGMPVRKSGCDYPKKRKQP